MILPATHRSRRSGYSLVELTIATGILAAGIAAAASLTLTSARIEEMNHRKARVLVLSEGAARLWQLGLSPTQAATLLPGDPALANITFDTGTIAASDQGTAVADPSTDLGTFNRLNIATSVLMRESSSPTAGDEQTQPLQVLTVVR
jgi:Tfp pilus assembly protein FimT